jgi:hypothetical protein
MGEILSVQPDRLVAEHHIESVQRTTIMVRAFLRGLVHLLMRPQHIFETAAKLFISPTREKNTHEAMTIRKANTRQRHPRRRHDKDTRPGQQIVLC